MRGALAAAAFVAVSAIAGSAHADVGVTLNHANARPGDRVRATSVRCCYLSLYLVPARLVPKELSCRMRNGVVAGCAPWSLGPPHRPGWVWIGRFFPKRPSFIFRVPPVGPGVYRPVVYCPPCYRGPRGSLIAGSQTLHIDDAASASDGWERLHRPLHLPRLAAGEPCPRTKSVRAVPQIVAALGRGPAYPTVGSRVGIAYLGPHSDTAHLDGWYFHKTIWTVEATYQGPLLLRGRRIDRPGSLRFQAYGPPSVARSRSELRWPAGWPTENRTPGGWRQLPGATVLRGPGCYAFQADGLTFSKVIVFQAVA